MSSKQKKIKTLIVLMNPKVFTRHCTQCLLTFSHFHCYIQPVALHTRQQMHPLQKCLKWCHPPTPTNPLANFIHSSMVCACSATGMFLSRRRRVNKMYLLVNVYDA